MFQAYAQQQVRRVIPPAIKAGGVWLGYLAIFAGLLWQLGRMDKRPSPAKRTMQPPARAEFSREFPSPDLPLYDDPRCSWPGGDVMPFVATDMRQPEILYNIRVKPL